MGFADRPADKRKGEWGKLAIFAGSERYPGAAVLTVAGAKRTGVDRVYFIGPRRAADAVVFADPSSPSYPLDGYSVDAKQLDAVPDVWDHAVAIGPGLGEASSVKKFVKEVLESAAGPFVLDADALRVLPDLGPKVLKDKQAVLTPNAREFSVLAGDETLEPSQSAAAELAREWGAVVLVKGSDDIVSDGSRTFEIEGGSSYLAKEGTGDVLTGAVGALLARGFAPLEAAKLGAMLVKEAGERAASDKGASMLSSDLPDYLDLRRLDSIKGA